MRESAARLLLALGRAEEALAELTALADTRRCATRPGRRGGA